MDKLHELQKLLRQKRGRVYYAQKLGVSVERVDELLEELKGNHSEQPLEDGEIKVTGLWKEVPTPEKIVARYKIDLKKYRLCPTWIKDHPEGYLVSVSFMPKAGKEKKTEEFVEFIKSYKSSHKPVVHKVDSNKLKGCLVINKQDAHLNKFDIQGKNDIEERFARIEERTKTTLHQATLAHTLDRIIYIIGSDQFNSEWTGATVKGTPQKNILPYDLSFQAICDHETEIINLLLKYAKDVEVVFIGGNHDEFVGWHMMSWLKAYYRQQTNLSIDVQTDYTKYRTYSNTALCFNHGDEQKPEKLAQNFPVEFRTQWSKCEYFIMLTGDKHTGISKDIGGIEWHQIAALSTARSNWDSKQGHLAKGRMTSFLIEEGEGIVNILRRTI